MSTCPDWENPQLLHRNREAPRASFIPFPSVEAARRGDRVESPWFRLLNGEWGFAYASDLARVPAGFETEGFEDAEWAALPVPGCRQLHGYGRPVYTNVNYPFPVDPPHVPTEDPVGLYRARFEIPPDWDGRQVFLVFESQTVAEEPEEGSRKISCPERFLGREPTGRRDAAMSQSDVGGFILPTAAPEAQPEPNVCKCCGTPEVERGYLVPICARCRTQLAARPVPLWIRATGVLVLIVMCIALARFPSAYSAAVAYERGRRAERAGDYARAVRE